MADTREGEDRAVIRLVGKSHEKEKGSARQIQPQGSSAQGGLSLGTSSNIRGDLPDTPKKREGSAPRNFARWTAIAVWNVLAATALAHCLVDLCRWLETGEGSSVIEIPPGDLVLTQSVPRNFARSTPIAVEAVLVAAAAALAYCLVGFFRRKSPPGDLVGLQGHKEQLVKLLLKDYSGMTDVLVKGGLGMTALVRKVCEDVRMRKHFDTIAWISVPQKYDSELIREEILLQLLFENFHEDFDVGGLGVEDFKFSSKYKGRCLIVVDNLFDQRTWNALNKVGFSAKTYRVIFIARREIGPWNGPLHKDGRQLKTYELEDLPEEEHLPEEELWSQFHKKSPEGDIPSPLKEVCQLIVGKFESLPAAIVLHLRNRKERNIGRKSMIFPSFERNDGWVPMVLPSNNCPSFNLIRQVLKILCTDDRRFCLLYLSIFPENYVISCKRVSRLWAADGFLPDLEKAEGFFNDLLNRKCIHRVEVRSDGELSTFRVDNLVRDIIVSLSDHRNLMTITSQGSTCWPESVRYPLVGFQLSSIFGFDVSSDEEKTTSEASPLETSKTPLFPFNLKHSKVLDVTGASFQIDPGALFELTDLRYLSLSNPSIKVIPGSIGKLMHLEFLVLKNSLVTKLPLEVARLQKIRHILIYHHEKDPLTESYNLIGFKASCRVGEFLDLEKLCFVDADERTLEDLGNLTKLRRLGITKLRKEHGGLLCTSLGKLKELRSLNVHALDEDEILDLNYRISPPKSLKHLYLHGRLEKLPDWISSLSNLTKVILRWSQLEEDVLATLGKLPNLVELELCRAYDGEQLDFKNGQFRKLKILLLDELEGLRSMSLEKGIMPCLENLTISRCQWLERIPSGVEYIRTIRKLTFFDMSREFYEMVRADHEKDHYQNFEHIPEVYFTQWRAGHWETHTSGQIVGKAQRKHNQKEASPGNILKKNLKPNRKLEIAKEKLKSKPVDITIAKEKRRSNLVDIFSVTEQSKSGPVGITITK